MQRLKNTYSLQQVPVAARLLGLAGLIPFVVPAVLIWVTSGEQAGGLSIALCACGAVILSFLGGVRWGGLLADTPTQWWPWVASILPSLVGWVAVLLGGVSGLALLAIGFAAQWFYDMKAVGTGELPAWFGPLRSVLSAGAVGSVVLGALALWLAH